MSLQVKNPEISEGFQCCFPEDGLLSIHCIYALCIRELFGATEPSTFWLGLWPHSVFQDCTLRTNTGVHVILKWKYTSAYCLHLQSRPFTCHMRLEPKCATLECVLRFTSCLEGSLRCPGLSNLGPLEWNRGGHQVTERQRGWWRAKALDARVMTEEASWRCKAISTSGLSADKGCYQHPPRLPRSFPVIL